MIFSFIFSSFLFPPSFLLFYFPSGNCLKGSRPILSFDKTFDSAPHLLVSLTTFTTLSVFISVEGRSRMNFIFELKKIRMRRKKAKYLLFFLMNFLVGQRDVLSSVCCPKISPQKQTVCRSRSHLLFHR